MKNTSPLLHIKIADNEEETENCRNLINQAFRETQHIARKDLPAICAEEMNDQLIGNGRELLMLYFAGSLVGTALLTLNQVVADIRYLAVVSAFRGRGFGEQLMRYMEDRAKTVHGKMKIGLATVQHPEHMQVPLQEWYKKQGYRYSNSFAPEKTRKHRWFAEEYHDHVTIKWFEKSLGSGAVK